MKAIGRRQDRDSPLLGWTYDRLSSEATLVHSSKNQRAKSGRRGKELLGCVRSGVTEMSLTVSVAELRRDPGLRLREVPKDTSEKGLLQAPRYKPRLGVSLASLLCTSVHIRKQIIWRPAGLRRLNPLRSNTRLKVVGTNIERRC